MVQKKLRASEIRTASGDEFKLIPLSEIHVDYDWNSRGGKWRDLKRDDAGNILLSGAEDDHHEFAAMVKSMIQHGQRDPVCVRPNPDKRTAGKKPYTLVYGFRRFAAIEEAAKQTKNKEPVIKAVVRELDDMQARLENTRENTERENLRPADLAVAAIGIRREAIAKRVQLTEAAIGEAIGRSQPYTGKLLTIAGGLIAGSTEGLDPELFKMWRESPVEIDVYKVWAVAKMPREKQREAFQKLVSASAGKGKKGNGEKSGPDRDNLLGKVSAVSQTLAVLEGNTIIDTVDADELFTTDNVKLLLDTKWDKWTPEDIEYVAAGAKDAFEKKRLELKAALGGM